MMLSVVAPEPMMLLVEAPEPMMLSVVTPEPMMLLVEATGTDDAVRRDARANDAAR